MVAKACQLLRPVKVLCPRWVTSVRYNATDEGFLPLSSECQNTADLFQLIEAYDTMEIAGHKHIVDCCSQLLFLVYEKEFSNIPWIIGQDYYIAHMQIVMNDLVDNLLSPFVQHPSFNKLLIMLEKKVDEMDGDELAVVFTSLQLLGLAEVHQIVHKIYFRLGSEDVHFTLKNISMLAEGLRNFKRSDIPMVNIVVPRIEELFAKDETGAGNKDDLDSLCNIFIRIKHLVGKEMNSEAVNRISGLASVDENLQDLNTISSCLRFVRHILSPHTGRTLSEKTLTKLSDIAENCLEKVNNNVSMMKPQDIAQICHNMKRLGIYNPTLSNKIHDKCMELLVEPVTVAELSCIVHGVSRRMPLDVRRNVEELVHRHIQDADVFILSNFADTLRSMNSTNIELMSAYEQKVLENVDKLSRFITLLHKVLLILLRSGTKYQPFHSQFQTELLRLLSTQQGVSIWCVSSLAMYLLPNSHLVIPQVLMDKLQAIIPQCDLTNLTKILVGLNLMHRPWVRQMHSQLLDLHTLLYRNIGAKLKNIGNLFTLCQTIEELYLKIHMKEPAVINQLMNQLPEFTKDLSERQFNRIISIFRRLFYYHPEVYEDLISHCIRNISDISFSSFSNLLHILSKVGYPPKQLDEFSLACTDVLEKSYNDLDVLSQLNFVYDMCVLQMFPDNWLKKIFTLDFLEEVDIFIADRPEVCSTVETLMMMLNRCVVLECPDLDVPWFHEDYCKEKSAIGNTAANTARGYLTFSTVTMKQVGDVLSDVLGGEQFYGKDVQSPYFYPLSFEALLDSKKNPVTYATSSIVRPEDMGYQRVAILLQPESAFCVDSKQLKGFELIRKRHLEIMGYKIVEVPYFDWQSMALTDWSAKVDYIQKQLFT
ncbi:hypothetical protein ScPMuIL_001493 [Solemya velum]